MKRKTKKIYVVTHNLEGFECRWSNAIKNNGYDKISRDFLKDLLPNGFGILVKRGSYQSGKDSPKESSLYLHRVIAGLYYNIVGKEIHHLNKIETQNDIWNLVPMEQGIHQEIDGWKDFEKGFNRSIELKKELQIAQFFKEYESQSRAKWSNQSSDGVILMILKLKTSGLSTKKIIKMMKGKAGEKKVREHLRTFCLAKEFSEYLELQLNEEFSDLYAKLDEKWRYVISWEKNKDTNLQEFEAFNNAQIGESDNQANLYLKNNGNEGIYYGYLMEEIF